MKLGIDLDGVVYDFVGAWQHQWRRTYPKRPLPVWRNWNYWEQDDADFTFDEWITNFRDGILDHNIFWSGLPMDGAVIGMKELADLGHEQVILTARQVKGAVQECRWGTYHWLTAHRVPHDDLVISGHADPKNIHGLDVMLDDRVENLEAAREAGEFAVAYDQLWNQEWNGPRITSWPEFVALIKEIG